MMTYNNFYTIAEYGNENWKGYYTQTGYMGYVEGRYILFASESEYYEYIKECD